MVQRVGCLGPRAAFSHLVVETFFGKNIEQILYTTIPKCIDAAANGEIDIAVVPIENTIEGTVNLTLDYLVHEQPLTIIGEIILPIQQHLMVHPSLKDDWKTIDRIYSHSHAIAQCHKFLHETFANAAYEYSSSTSAAAEYASNHPDERIGVVASELAAKEYGLEIVQKNIHDYPYNHTRFVILHPSQKNDLFQTEYKREKEKTTLMITLPSDQSGTLHQVLSAFTWRKLNLSKIESRPMKTGLGRYFFIIDIDMLYDDVLIPGAIAELEALGCSVKLLGSYGAYTI
ncbi:prephenate dehydratase [Metabacillus fastidiosus]|uniref:prephenate dehydratase n=1 Tax=Metabacillus fastidiosus TaxID=1458 RepID=UPI002DB8986F|nr:prephenate dehydratase [Metabacillus fastidiosus]MEC2076768.1 prephenate dehydratase [Metabacillus fastidiosus]